MKKWRPHLFWWALILLWLLIVEGLFADLNDPIPVLVTSVVIVLIIIYDYTKVRKH